MDEMNKPEARPRSFFAFLAALPLLISSRIAASLFGRFFCGYEKSCELLRESRTARRIHTSKVTEKLVKFRYSSAQKVAKSHSFSLLHRLFTVLQQTRLRAYGLFLATFGIYTVLVYIAKYFAFATIAAERSSLITGIILIVLGLPLLLTPLTLHQCLEEGRALGGLLYRVAGLRIYARKHSEKAQITTTLRGLLAVDENGMTNIPGVFAAGDVVSGPKTVVEAVAHSKKVAEQMAKYCYEKRK